MATNEILPFASTDTGTNLLSQAAYSADAERTVGNTTGAVARAELVNKAMRQSSVIAAGLAKFIADNQATNITDELTAAQVATAITAALAAVAPVAANAAIPYDLDGSTFNGVLTSFEYLLPVEPNITGGRTVILIHSGVGNLLRVSIAPTVGKFQLTGATNRTVTFGLAPTAGDWVHAIFVAV